MVTPVNTDCVETFLMAVVGFAAGSHPEMVPSNDTNRKNVCATPGGATRKSLALPLKTTPVGGPIAGGGTDGGIVTTNPFPPGFKGLAGVPWALWSVETPLFASETHQGFPLGPLAMLHVFVSFGSTVGAPRVPRSETRFVF